MNIPQKKQTFHRGARTCADVKYTRALSGHAGIRDTHPPSSFLRGKVGGGTPLQRSPCPCSQAWRPPSGSNTTPRRQGSAHQKLSGKELGEWPLTQSIRGLRVCLLLAQNRGASCSGSFEKVWSEVAAGTHAGPKGCPALPPLRPSRPSSPPAPPALPPSGPWGGPLSAAGSPQSRMAPELPGLHLLRAWQGQVCEAVMGPGSSRGQSPTSSGTVLARRRAGGCGGHSPTGSGSSGPRARPEEGLSHRHMQSKWVYSSPGAGPPPAPFLLTPH